MVTNGHYRSGLAASVPFTFSDYDGGCSGDGGNGSGDKLTWLEFITRQLVFCSPQSLDNKVCQ